MSTEAPRPAVRWDRVERIRVEGQTQYVMISSETPTVIVGYILRRDSDGDLDFQTVAGEDQTSRVLFLTAKELITRRTPMMQNLDYGTWVPKAARS
jgi:hypothetical protein